MGGETKQRRARTPLTSCMDYYNKTHQPRRPTETEFAELCELELKELKAIRRQNGHCSYDAGDLGYMLDTASIVVFDNYNTINTPSRMYRGKLMVVVWSLRLIAEYVWIEGKLVKVTEDNRSNVW